MREFTQAEKFFYFMSPTSGGSPPTIDPPPGFAGKYIAYTIDTAFVLQPDDKISQWNDLDNTPADNLTQGTTLNQYQLIEANTVKQSTVANQPVYDWDKIVTNNTLSRQPIYNEVSGEKVLEFVGDRKHIAGFSVSGDSINSESLA